MKHNVNEGLKYLSVGIGAVAIDFIGYMILLNINPSVAKAISYVLGACFAFLANKFWTFQSKNAVQREVWKFVLLYILTFASNVGINAVFLSLSAHKIIGFTFATGFSIIVNYIGQKFWVFKGQFHVK